MNNEVMAQQLREWAGSLARVGATDEMLMRGIIAGMQQVAADIAPKIRLRRRVKITRYWFEDKAYVEGRMAENPVLGWQCQIAEEFDGCGVSGPAGEGASVITSWSPSVAIVTHDDENMTATFTATLDFEYGDPDYYTGVVTYTSDDDKDFDLIQRIFYDEGRVAGNFALLPDIAPEE